MTTNHDPVLDTIPLQLSTDIDVVDEFSSKLKLGRVDKSLSQRSMLSSIVEIGRIICGDGELVSSLHLITLIDCHCSEISIIINSKYIVNKGVRNSLDNLK